jgi:hypothetical protein
MELDWMMMALSKLSEQREFLQAPPDGEYEGRIRWRLLVSQGQVRKGPEQRSHRPSSSRQKLSPLTERHGFHVYTARRTIA